MPSHLFRPASNLFLKTNARVSTSSQTKRGGFTIVETTFVIAILVVLFGTIQPIIFDITKRSQRNLISNELQRLRIQVYEFQLFNGRLPESLAEVDFDSDRFFYDPVSGALLATNKDYCFRFVARSNRRFERRYDIIAEPCGEKRDGAIRLAIDENGEIRELRPDEFALAYEEALYRQSIIYAQRNLAELLELSDEEAREKIYKVLFGHEFQDEMLNAYILLDENLDETIDIRELRQFSQIGPNDDPNLVRAKSAYGALLEETSLPDDFGIAWMDQMSDGSEFISPTNVSYFLESITSDNATARSMTAPLKSIELLVREKNHVAIQRVLTNVRRQIDRASGETITPRDAQLGTVLIELLDYKYR